MEFTIQDIQNILPHRYPFLLVDRILEQGEDSIVGLKNVTVNEPFFQGHFPGIPIMPGVLIIEAMAQVSGILFLSQQTDGQKRITYFAGIDKAKFRKPVVPGDQLRFEITVSRMRSTSLKTHGVAKVDGEVVAEADLFMMTETIAKEG
jgi:beta-hydroxyacyl-ACP dehydratase FabZ